MHGGGLHLHTWHGGGVVDGVALTTWQRDPATHHGGLGVPRRVSWRGIPWQNGPPCPFVSCITRPTAPLSLAPPPRRAPPRPAPCPAAPCAPRPHRHGVVARPRPPPFLVGLAAGLGGRPAPPSSGFGGLPMAVLVALYLLFRRTKVYFLLVIFVNHFC